MSTHRLALAGVTIFAATGLMLAGCHSDSSSTAAPATSGGTASAPATPASSAPPVAPKDALVAATTKLTKTTYAFTIDADGGTGQGAADPIDRAGTASISANADASSLSLKGVSLGKDSFIQIDLGKTLNGQAGLDPTTWYQLDTTKIGAANQFIDTDSDDLFDFATLGDAITNVQRTDATHYTGTLDLNKVKGPLAGDSDALTKAGAKAQSVTFSATLDSQGRLADFKIDASAFDTTLSGFVSFRDYGAKQLISKPTGTIVAAPSVIYDIFNS